MEMYCHTCRKQFRVPRGTIALAGKHPHRGHIIGEPPRKTLCSCRRTEICDLCKPARS